MADPKKETTSQSPKKTAPKKTTTKPLPEAKPWTETTQQPEPVKAKKTVIRRVNAAGVVYNDPVKLQEKINEYFEWCDNNPFKEQLVFHAKGIITKTHVSKLRPYTLEGLCIFLQICVNTFKSYTKDEQLMTVATCARDIIDNQQYEGAAAGLLSQAIVAQKLGLAKKVELDAVNTNFDGGQASAERIKKIAEALEDKY